MKKILTVLIGGTLISFANSNANAQKIDNNIAYEAGKNNAKVSFPTVDEATDVKSVAVLAKTSKADLKAIKANFKATELFKEAFKDAPEAKWATGINTIVAYFTKDSLRTQAVFNKSGILLHYLTFYPADKTPKAIRSIIKDVYSNANINLLTEVKENDMDFYIVNIEDKKTFKEIAIYNNEIVLLKEYNKSTE